MYAIIRAQGKQFRAVPDATIRIPTLEAEPGDTVSFEVLLTAKDGDVRVGTPALEGARVDAEVVAHGRDDKIIVYKMKRRKGYRRKQGHRQGYTEIRITDIAFPKGKKQTVKAPQPAAEKAKPEVEKPSAAAEPAAAEPETAAEPRPEAATKAVEPEVDAEPEAAADDTPAETVDAADDFDITPAARALADDHNIDLASIEGTGKDGRILKSDVDKAIKDKEGA